MTPFAQLPLERSEYIEQAYLYELLEARIIQQVPIQELLEQVRLEIAANTRLPLAIDFLLTELKHSGTMAPAMRRLGHYFTPFQTYLIEEAEADRGKFDMRVALKILRCEVTYRAEGGTCEGLFFFQFEAICRNRLRYDPGLTAIEADPSYPPTWKAFIHKLNRELGLVDLADLIFLHSQHYRELLLARGESLERRGPFLLGSQEGRIAVACRRRDPLYLFGALQRHLGYPAVPRVQPPDRTLEALPQILRKLEQLEQRLKLMEQENKSGIDITRYYGRTPD